MDFHEIRFPASLSFGSVGGPMRRTDVVALANGFEERNTPLGTFAPGVMTRAWRCAAWTTSRH